MSTYPPGFVFSDVEAFNKKLAPRQTAPFPQWRPQDIVDLRWRLIDEEVNTELKQALERMDLVEVVDAALDSIYVIAGMLTAFGVKGQPIWDAIHRANMRKEGGEMREDGKVLKPLGWKHPNIAEYLAEQGMMRPID